MPETAADGGDALAQALHLGFGDVQILAGNRCLELAQTNQAFFGDTQCSTQFCGLCRLAAELER